MHNYKRKPNIMSSTNKFLSRFAEYQEEVETVITSDTIDTTESDHNVVADSSSDTSESSYISESDTSEFNDSDSVSSISEFSDDGDTFQINPNVMAQNPSYLLGMYNRSMNIPILDPAYQMNLLENGRNVTGDPLYGMHIGSRPSCRVHLNSKDQAYLSQVINTHNGLQDLLKAMCDNAFDILKINLPKIPVIHINKSDFDLNHYGNFVDKLCEHKRSMLRTMDLVNSVYNKILDYLKRNPAERTPEETKKLQMINYNWNMFLANYLPLVPTTEDKEYFRQTGTHRLLKPEDLIPDPKSLDPLRKSLTGGASTGGAPLDDTNRQAQDVMRRIKSFISGNETDTREYRIDTAPLSVADDPQKRKALMLEGERAGREAVVDGNKTVSRTVGTLNEGDAIGANDPLDAVQNIQKLEGENNLSISRATVPTFTVEYSDVDIDAPLREYTNNLNAPIEQKSELSSVLSKLRANLDYDYSHLNSQNVKLIAEPKDLTEVDELKQRMGRYLKSYKIHKKALKVIDEEIKPAYRDEGFIGTMSRVIDAIPRDSLPNNSDLPSFLRQAREYFTPSKNVDEGYFRAGLTLLKKQAGTRWNEGNGAIEFSDLDGNPDIDRRIDILQRQIIDPLPNPTFTHNDKTYRYKKRNVQTKTTTNVFANNLKAYNRYQANRDTVEMIDALIDTRGSFMGFSFPNVDKLQLNIEIVLHTLDAQTLESFLQPFDIELQDKPENAIDKIEENKTKIKKKYHQLKSQVEEFVINEFLDTSDYEESGLYTKNVLQQKHKEIGLNITDDLTKMMGGGTVELDQALKAAERDIKNVATNLFDTISKVDANKSAYNATLEMSNEIDRLKKGISSYTELVTSVNYAIWIDKLRVLKYLRLNVLRDARLDFQKIMTQDTEYNFTLNKMVRLIDRIEKIIGDSSQNVVQISLEEAYQPSFIHLVLLYFMILCIKQQTEGEIESCLSD